MLSQSEYDALSPIDRCDYLHSTLSRITVAHIQALHRQMGAALGAPGHELINDPYFETFLSLSRDAINAILIEDIASFNSITSRTITHLSRGLPSS